MAKTWKCPSQGALVISSLNPKLLSTFSSWHA